VYISVFNKCVLQTSRSILAARTTHGFLPPQSGSLLKKGRMLIFTWKVPNEVCAGGLPFSSVYFLSSLKTQNKASFICLLRWYFWVSLLLENVLALRLIPSLKMGCILCSNHLACIGSWGRHLTSWKWNKTQNSEVRRWQAPSTCNIGSSIWDTDVLKGTLDSL
jgi:hypothetical protein